jgi:hypothetical protein
LSGGRRGRTRDAFGRHVRERADRAFEQGVEAAAAERREHRAVLLLHDAANDGGDVRLGRVLGVVRFRRLDDAAAVSEEVRDDARKLHAGIFGLDVEDPAAVADVVVEAEDWRRHFGHRPNPRVWPEASRYPYL